MAWKKIGRIFKAEGQHEWMNSHATVPVPHHLQDDIYRIYSSTRDKLNRNRIGSIEVWEFRIEKKFPMEMLF